MRTASLMALVLLCACNSGVGSTTTDQPTPDHDPGQPTLPGNNPGNKPRGEPQPDGFDIYELSAAGRAPVVAVAPDGARHTGHITSAGKALLTMEGAPAVALEGSGEAKRIAMTTGSDGSLHVVTDPGGTIQYQRIEADGTMHAPIALQEGRSPTIALAAADEVVVAFTQDMPPDAMGLPQTDRVLVARGQVSGTFAGFEEAVEANAGCCSTEFADAADTVSGPSLALGPDGAVHVVYEWMTFSNTTVDYVVETSPGQFAAPLPVAQAAFSPCPALAVDEQGAHITYLLEFNQDVWYVNVDEAGIGEPVSLHHTDEGDIRLALMTRDAGGAMHVVAEERLWDDTTRLSYLRVEDGVAAEPMLVTEAEGPTAFRLSPTAGGLAIDGDELLVPFTVAAEDSSVAKMAVGR
jgi:hypothetical protein